MICLRCHQPITHDGQTCFFKGARWLCVSDDNKTIIEVNGLLLKTGGDANPVPILEDYYK